MNSNEEKIFKYICIISFDMISGNYTYKYSEKSQNIYAKVTIKTDLVLSSITLKGKKMLTLWYNTGTPAVVL